MVVDDVLEVVVVTERPVAGATVVEVDRMADSPTRVEDVIDREIVVTVATGSLLLGMVDEELGGRDVVVFVSAVTVKFRMVLEAIPANEFPATSRKAPESINT